jgi:pimeloyl-ACP methyl ester carboxylesterase
MKSDSMLFTETRDGVRIAYDVRGEGKPVVLVHGYASSRVQNWGSTGWIDRLSQHGFRVVSFDCRGHGFSEKPHDPQAYGDRMLDDITAVMDAADTKDAYLLGYSMGAQLSIRFMMLNPARVKRVAAAGVGEKYFSENVAWRGQIADAMLIQDSKLIDDLIAARFRKFADQRGKDRFALAACMRAPRHFYNPEELKAAQRPVLVVAGENDDLAGSPFPLAKAFPDGRAVILPNRDHMTAVGDPGYKRAVLEFFSE